MRIVEIEHVAHLAVRQPSASRSPSFLAAMAEHGDPPASNRSQVENVLSRMGSGRCVAAGERAAPSSRAPRASPREPRQNDNHVAHRGQELGEVARELLAGCGRAIARALALRRRALRVRRRGRDVGREHGQARAEHFATPDGHLRLLLHLGYTRSIPHWSLPWRAQVQSIWPCCSPRPARWPPPPNPCCSTAFRHLGAHDVRAGAAGVRTGTARQSRAGHVKAAATARSLSGTTTIRSSNPTRRPK